MRLTRTAEYVSSAADGVEPTDFPQDGRQTGGDVKIAVWLRGLQHHASELLVDGTRVVISLACSSTGTTGILRAVCDVGLGRNQRQKSRRQGVSSSVDAHLPVVLASTTEPGRNGVTWNRNSNSCFLYPSRDQDTPRGSLLLDIIRAPELSLACPRVALLRPKRTVVHRRQYYS